MYVLKTRNLLNGTHKEEALYDFILLKLIIKHNIVVFNCICSPIHDTYDVK